MTPKQIQLLRFIRNNMVHKGRGPTYKEMRDYMKVASNQAIIDWLTALKKNGSLEWEKGEGIGIKKTEEKSEIKESSSKRDPNEFTAKVKDTLAKRAAQTCSLCNRATSGPHSEKDKSISVGKAAHIYGKQPGAARYDENMTTEQRSDISNAIWICGNCHDLIDKDEKKYPADILIQRKEQHEHKVLDSMFSSFGIRYDIGLITATTTAEMLDDENIKKSFEAWGNGDFIAAYDFAQDAYFASSGEIKLQAIVNMILFGEKQLQRADYYISLCDEGIALAKSLKSFSTGAVLKAHKSYFLQNRAFRYSLQIYEETQLRRLVGFPSKNNSELSSLIEAVNRDSKEIDSLVMEAHAEAIKSRSYDTLAHVKMTVGNAIGLTYILTKQLGGDTGKIEQFTIRMLTEAKEIYEKMKDKDGVGNALHNIANNLRFFGDVERAKRYAMEALQIAKETGNKELEIKSTELLHDRLEEQELGGI